MGETYLSETKPKSQMLAKLASAMRSAREFGNKARVPENIPLLGGTGLGDFMLQRAPEGMETLAYGEPLTTGSGETLHLKDQMLDLGTLGMQGLGQVRKGAAAAGSGMLSKAIKGGKKEAAEAAGYWHPVGTGLKLNKPVGEMTSKATDAVPMAPRKTISPEAMQGSVLVPAYGDRSAAGKYLTHVGENELTDPVLLQGGADFMRMYGPQTGGVWANAKGASTLLANRIRQGAERGNGDVYMPYVAMGHDSIGFNTNMSDALVDLMRQRDLSPKAMREFNAAMKGRADFPGVENDRLAELLRQGPGLTRSAMADVMGKRKFQDLGFPDVAETRKAITDPALLDAKTSMGGYTVGKMDPTGRLIDAPSVRHETFPVQLAGEYAGGFDQQVPRDILFPKWFKEREASGLPAPQRASADAKSFMSQQPLQEADQQWLDGVMSWLEANRQGGAR